MSVKQFVTWILPAVLLVVFGLLEVLGVFQPLEHAVYDTWLHVKPEVVQREEILFLDVDDLAIEQVGVWPWSRDIMARGLIVLREFGAGPTVFDIEYVNDSPLAVDGRLLQEDIPNAIDREFGEVTGNFEDLVAAIAAGQIEAREATAFLDDLQNLSEVAEDRLLTRVQEVVRNNDTLLGNAASAMGNAWFTVTLLPDTEEPIEPERLALASERAALREVEGENALIPDVEGLRPAIYPVLSGGRGAGFPNVVVDSDGTRRRIELLSRHDGEWFGQLVFAPLLHWLGSPALDVSRNRIVLRDAVLPGEDEPRDVRIPLAEDGSLLLNWPKGDYLESFRHLTYYELVHYESLMGDLAFNLELMQESGYLQYHDGQSNPLQAWYYAEGIVTDALETGDYTSLTDLASIREFFVSESGAFLDGSAEDAILGDIAAALADPELSPEVRALFEDLSEDIPSAFASTREIHRSLVERRTNLLEAVPGSFIIIGYTGTGTTDIGVNPFVNEYANVGTHGAVVNTIITERFIDDLPVWVSIVIAALFTALYVLVSRKRSATGSLALGFAGAGTVVVGSAATMVVARLFLPVMAPALTVFLSAIGQSLFKYIELAKERNYIRHAFNHYLSADVINEIIDDPSRLRLGGEKRELTAMFTDVKGFSTISESLDPEDLVKLLNRYLSEMSDIILQLRGTIDKYEGDAIISFFGAPVAFADHATRACSAAIRMKKIERYLNDHFLEEQLSPSPLATRVGINTGEMVVGNMGTANRMDYTIMGHSVNLAARLEGVNKQYGTWILTSELTYNDTHDAFVARKLDRVRVVGVNEPVRLYELIDETDQAVNGEKEMVDEFHHGLTLFEGREWGEAGGIFSRINRELPKDGPSRVFLERCEQFQKEPPPANWDGVFNLTRK